ncbi:exocyst complex component 4-like isoform X1 [Mizuhopecten yessoensis]|uniref:exocyst complex component 4-like isoform X1 n=2 Tax=Mizuhopecten yessoensis TaxID=6573 RepID=UPI000B45937B|nr:exocyst complex component 4-like isoform X1 [Mizuhopecten yessoensis]
MASDGGEVYPSPSSKGRETSDFLMMIVRTLSTSADFEQREKEKARIEKSFRQSDKLLGELVTDNYEDLTRVTQAFSTISKKIYESRDKIKKIKDDLSSCKTLLHCKRDELRRLWIEGVEHKTMVSLLDQIEQIKEVPTKLDNFLLTKHYLHATDLVVQAVAKLEGPLSGVMALRDLKSELTTRKEQLHEVLIGGLNKQIYVTVPANQKPSYRRTDSLTRQGDYPSLERKKRSGQDMFPTVEPFTHEEIKEDLNSNPEENPSHFIALLVESLFVLKKVPDGAEGLKIRIQPELSAIVARASQQVVENSCQQGELLANNNQPRFLLELLMMVFQQFRLVAHMHKMVLRNLNRVIPTTAEHQEEKSGVLIRGEQMYDMTDVWSKIQAVIELLLREYLDVQNTAASRQRAPSSFDEPSTDISQYFSKKRPNKPKKPALFRFDASIHAMSTNSYVEDSRAFDTSDMFNASMLAEMGLEKHQMVCKPSVYNITAIFKPLQDFIREVEDAIACMDGSSSLQAFVTDFVQDIFLGQVHYSVKNSIEAATIVDEEEQCFDSLRHVVDHKTQRDLGVSRPLLTSTVIVDKNIQDLQELMQDLPTYADQFLNMICNILKDYRDTCHTAYRGMVQYDADEKRMISAMWAKDEDISRFLRSLPSWQVLQPMEGQDMNQAMCSEEEMRTLNSKEVNILISNLSSSDSMIPQQEIITDATQMRTIANYHQSLEWFTGRLGHFAQSLSSKSDKHGTQKSSKYPPVSHKALESLNTLEKDFQDLAEICLLLLHLEVRVHCFYYLELVARKSNYAGPIDDLDPDSNVLKLNKDLTAMEEVLSQSLQPNKFKYIFEGLGFLVASILMNSIQFLPKINENGIKKMCRNLFAIQQNLTNISMSRETDLDMARQYYELLYLNQDDILTAIAEKGAQFTYTEYCQLIQLYHRSHPGGDPNQLDKRMQRLREIIEKGQNGVA